MADFSPHFDDIDIAIIGAGIGGVAAALALQQAGVAAELFEQAPELREVGGAIVVRAASMALLARWGVLDTVRPKMVAVNQVELRDRDGSVLRAAPASIEPGEPEFAYCAHRADLHDALVSKLLPGRLHLGHRLVSVETTADCAEARFENGRHIRARLIVGADGLRSVVRTLLDATPMTFLNLVTNRTIAPASLLPSDMPNDRIRLWQDRALKLIMLPIRNGGEVAINAAISADTPPETLWGSTTADEILQLYADFSPLIARLIKGRTAEITTHPVYDKEPIARWFDRHIVLLGDAAHPMAPMNGQGANQAIQDGDALAAALTGHHHDDLASALLDYQSTRAPVTARIQGLSRRPPAATLHPAQKPSQRLEMHHAR
jgi:salicylate hydroxylase